VSDSKIANDPLRHLSLRMPARLTVHVNTKHRDGAAGNNSIRAPVSLTHRVCALMWLECKKKN
jgi:hypothetical protein